MLEYKNYFNNNLGTQIPHPSPPKERKTPVCETSVCKKICLQNMEFYYSKISGISDEDRSKN